LKTIKNRAQLEMLPKELLEALTQKTQKLENLSRKAAEIPKLETDIQNKNSVIIEARTQLAQAQQEYAAASARISSTLKPIAQNLCP